MTILARRRPFRTNAATITKEFTVAVTLFAIVVLIAGGVSDLSMRAGAVVAAIFLMAAEIYRQMPELARHATAPLRRLLRADELIAIEGAREGLAALARSTIDNVIEDSYRQTPASYPKAKLEPNELGHSLAALAAATRESVQACAHAEQTIERAMAEWRRAFDDRDNAYTHARQTIERAMAEWRRAFDDHDKRVVKVLDAIAQQSDTRDALMREAVRQLDRIAAKLDSTMATSPAAPQGPPDPTSIAWFSHELEAQLLKETLASVNQRAANPWRFEAHFTLHDLLLEHDLMMQHRGVSLRNPYALWFIQEAGHRKLFGSLQSDPEAFKRFLEEIVASIVRSER